MRDRESERERKREGERGFRGSEVGLQGSAGDLLLAGGRGIQHTLVSSGD